jgi:hypothetical protein
MGLAALSMAANPIVSASYGQQQFFDGNHQLASPSKEDPDEILTKHIIQRLNSGQFCDGDSSTYALVSRGRAVTFIEGSIYARTNTKPSSFTFGKAKNGESYIIVWINLTQTSPILPGASRSKLFGSCDICSKLVLIRRCSTRTHGDQYTGGGTILDDKKSVDTKAYVSPQTDSMCLVTTADISIGTHLQHQHPRCQDRTSAIYLHCPTQPLPHAHRCRRGIHDSKFLM